jgi:NADH dehydrogenase
VELAGALAELARNMRRDFRTIDPREARVLLLEGGPHVLPTFAPELREFAARALDRLGVEVRTGALVTNISPDGVEIGSEKIPAATTLWAAGVAAAPIGRTLGVPLDKAGRVLVEPDLTIPGHPNVYVIGDLASLKDASGRPLPGVAPVAMQQAARAADNIVRALQGQPRRAFAYKDPGSLATIGRAAAVADFGRVKLTGLIAWLTWLFVHIMKLTGFRNRILVFVQWAWAYFTQQRAVRLITDTRGERERTA